MTPFDRAPRMRNHKRPYIYMDGFGGLATVVALTLVLLPAANAQETACTATQNGATFATATGSLGPITHGNSETCSWTIATGGSIYLAFTAFNMEASYDYVKVFDGSSATAPSLGSFTGTAVPGVVGSTSGSLFIQMTSDSSVLGTGFAFRWQADPLTNPPTGRPSIAPSRLPTRELGMTTTDPCPTARSAVCDVPATCPQGDWTDCGVICRDNDRGQLDLYNRPCASYGTFFLVANAQGQSVTLSYLSPSVCGQYDSVALVASVLCCFCGGGTKTTAAPTDFGLVPPSAAPTRLPTNLPTTRYPSMAGMAPNDPCPFRNNGVCNIGGSRPWYGCPRRCTPKRLHKPLPIHRGAAALAPKPFVRVQLAHFVQRRDRWHAGQRPA